MQPTQKDFFDYIKDNWAALSKEQKCSLGKNPKEVSVRVWAIYQGILDRELPFSLIGPKVRLDKRLIGNFGVIVSNASKKNKAKFVGSILTENPWSLLINDIFMLATINRAHEVHLVLYDNLTLSLKIENAENQHLSTLGREIAMLKACGYSISRSDYVCGFKSDSCTPLTPLRIDELRDKIRNITPQEIRDYLDFNANDQF